MCRNMWVNRIHPFSYPGVLIHSLIFMAEGSIKIMLHSSPIMIVFKLLRCHLSRNLEICAKVSWVVQVLISCFILSCFTNICVQPDWFLYRLLQKLKFENIEHFDSETNMIIGKLYFHLLFKDLKTAELKTQ